jgi:hypothetical protein
MLPRLTTNLCRSLAVLGLAVLFAAEAQAGDPQYLAAVTDLPLPPGLVEDLDAGVNFDKPEGRIVEAVARGSLSKLEVGSFYRAALPGLGWKRLTDDGPGTRWQRGGEILNVDIVDNGNPLVVRFSIAPD